MNNSKNDRFVNDAMTEVMVKETHHHAHLLCYCLTQNAHLFLRWIVLHLFAALVTRHVPRYQVLLVLREEVTNSAIKNKVNRHNFIKF